MVMVMRATIADDDVCWKRLSFELVSSHMVLILCLRACAVPSLFFRCFLHLCVPSSSVTQARIPPPLVSAHAGTERHRTSVLELVSLIDFVDRHLSHFKTAVFILKSVIEAFFLSGLFF